MRRHIRKHGRVIRRRRAVAFTVGIGVMLCGSSIACFHHFIPLICMLPVVVADGLAYFLHGLGAVPFALQIEPLWRWLEGLE